MSNIDITFCICKNNIRVHKLNKIGLQIHIFAVTPNNEIQAPRELFGLASITWLHKFTVRQRYSSS